MNEFSEKDRLALTVYKDSMNKFVEKKNKEYKKSIEKLREKIKTEKLSFFERRKAEADLKKLKEKIVDLNKFDSRLKDLTMFKIPVSMGKTFTKEDEKKFREIGTRIDEKMLKEIQSVLSSDISKNNAGLAKQIEEINKESQKLLKSLLIEKQHVEITSERELVTSAQIVELTSSRTFETLCNLKKREASISSVFIRPLLDKEKIEEKSKEEKYLEKLMDLYTKSKISSEDFKKLTKGDYYKCLESAKNARKLEDQQKALYYFKSLLQEKKEQNRSLDFKDTLEKLDEMIKKTSKEKKVYSDIVSEIDWKNVEKVIEKAQDKKDIHIVENITKVEQEKQKEEKIEVKKEEDITLVDKAVSTVKEEQEEKKLTDEEKVEKLTKEYLEEREEKGISLNQYYVNYIQAKSKDESLRTMTYSEYLIKINAPKEVIKIQQMKEERDKTIYAKFIQAKAINKDLKFEEFVNQNFKIDKSIDSVDLEDIPSVEMEGKSR